MRRRLTHTKVVVYIVTLTLLWNELPIYGASHEGEGIEVPIIWERSSEEYGSVLGVSEGEWNWNIANSITTPITDREKIWDAQYDAYYTEYIEWLGDDIHSAATWETQNGVDLRRFRGTFTIPKGYSTEDFVRLRSVVQQQYSHLNNGNIIAINDNIYVFVYPKSIEAQITDDETSPYYFADYLAFWTGTANRPQYGIQTFYGKPGTYSNHDWDLGPVVTDGWYAEATMDNLGMIMHQATGGAGSETEFVIDVFTEDNSPGGGGGMDELVLEFISNPNASVEANNETYAIPSNKETLIQSHSGLLANEGLDGTINCTLKEDTINGFRLEAQADGKYKVYKEQEHIANINYIDKMGQFRIEPINNYVGRIQFEYEVADKLGKSDIGQAEFYVMPKVEILHKDIETDEVLIKEKVQYGNPYAELPENTIYSSDVLNIKDNINIKTSTRLDGQYKYIKGEIISPDREPMDFSTTDYQYSYQEANEEVILTYKRQYPKLNVKHEYSEDEGYTNQVPMGEVDHNDRITAGGYSDTTVRGDYSKDTKYEISDVKLSVHSQEIEELSTQPVDEIEISSEEVITLLPDDTITLLAGNTYDLTIYYDVKSYEIHETHVYDNESGIIEEYSGHQPYGSQYTIKPMQKVGYDFKTYEATVQHSENDMILIEEDLNIIYYYNAVEDKPVTPPGESGGTEGGGNPPAEDKPVTPPGESGGTEGGGNPPAEDKPVIPPGESGGTEGGGNPPAEDKPVIPPDDSDGDQVEEFPPTEEEKPVMPPADSDEDGNDDIIIDIEEEPIPGGAITDRPNHSDEETVDDDIIQGTDKEDSEVVDSDKLEDAVDKEQSRPENDMNQQGEDQSANAMDQEQSQPENGMDEQEEEQPENAIDQEQNNLEQKIEHVDEEKEEDFIRTDQAHEQGEIDELVIGTDSTVGQDKEEPQTNDRNIIRLIIILIVSLAALVFINKNRKK